MFNSSGGIWQLSQLRHYKDFSIDLILPATLEPWSGLDLSISNRNEHKNLPGGKERLVHMDDDPTAICKPAVLENVGALTSHDLMGLHA
jgi:hypothetical protein